MKVNNVAWTVIGCVFFLTFSSTNAQLQPPYFYDDFEDGSVDDGDPVTWTPEAPFDRGTREVIDGSFVVTPGSIPTEFFNYSESDTVAAGVVFQDVSVRTQVRVLEDSDYIVGVAARGAITEAGLQDGSVYGAYWASRKQLTIGAFNVTQDRETNWYATTALDAHSSDLNLKLDVVGDTAALTAWADGQEMPDEPQLFVSNLPAYAPTEGHLGMWTGQFLSSPRSPVAFRFFEAAPIPEPSSAALCLVGLLVFPLVRKRT